MINAKKQKFELVLTTMFIKCKWRKVRKIVWIYRLGARCTVMYRKKLRKRSYLLVIFFIKLLWQILLLFQLFYRQAKIFYSNICDVIDLWRQILLSPWCLSLWRIRNPMFPAITNPVNATSKWHFKIEHFIEQFVNSSTTTTN